MGKNPFAISFKKTAGDRNAYRAKIPGLHVKVAGKSEVYAARDISPTGVGLGGGVGLREGQVLTLNLFFKGKLIASELKARVMRVSSSFTGLQFANLDRRQADAVHTLVLNEQKRMAEERKNEKKKSIM